MDKVLDAIRSDTSVVEFRTSDDIRAFTDLLQRLLTPDVLPQQLARATLIRGERAAGGVRNWFYQVREDEGGALKFLIATTPAFFNEATARAETAAPAQEKGRWTDGASSAGLPAPPARRSSRRKAPRRPKRHRAR